MILPPPPPSHPTTTTWTGSWLCSGRGDMTCLHPSTTTLPTTLLTYIPLLYTPIYPTTACSLYLLPFLLPVFCDWTDVCWWTGSLFCALPLLPQQFCSSCYAGWDGLPATTTLCLPVLYLRSFTYLASITTGSLLGGYLILFDDSLQNIYSSAPCARRARDAAQHGVKKNTPHVLSPSVGGTVDSILLPACTPMVHEKQNSSMRACLPLPHTNMALFPFLSLCSSFCTPCILENILWPSLLSFVSSCNFSFIMHAKF